MSKSSWLRGLLVVAGLSGWASTESRAQDKPKVQKLTSGRHDTSVEKAVDLLKGLPGSAAASDDRVRREGIPDDAHHATWLANRQCVNCHFQVPEQSPSSPCLRNAQPIGKEAYLGAALARVPAVLRQHVKLTSQMGLLVETVDTGSPAQQAGLEQYDVVERIDDQWLVNPEQFRVLMRSLAAGSDVKLTVVQQGESRSLVARLGERPQWTSTQATVSEQAGLAGSAFKDLQSLMERREFYRQADLDNEEAGPLTYLGVQCSDPPAALVKQLKLAPDMGLLVDGVLKQSPAQAAGLKRHDLLQKLDDQLLVNHEQLMALIRSRQPDTLVKLTLLRDGAPLVVDATLGRQDSVATSDDAGGMAPDTPIDRGAHRSPQRWKESFLASWPSEQASDELFLRRLYLDLLGVPPTPAEMKRFVDDAGSNKREAAIDMLLAQPEAVSRLSGQAAAQWIDRVHQISLSRPDGSWHLRAETAQGEKLFDGLVDTESQRETLPEELRTKLQVMQGRLAAEESADEAATAHRSSGEEALARVIPQVELKDVTLDQAVKQLRGQTGANLVLNIRALRQAGVDLDETFSLSLAEVRLSTVLRTLLALAAGDQPLACQVRDEVILLTTQSAISDMP